ncbi:MAG: transcriptional regulator PpsR [Sphingomonadaceae bacterium]
MDAQTPSTEPFPFRSPETSLGSLDHDLAASLIGAAGDLALVVDREGVIRDMAVGSRELAEQGVESWIGQPWSETVHPDSRPKVIEMLASGREPGPWRQVNQLAEQGDLPLRFLAVGTGEGVIAVGRDLRAVAQMQQRLIQAQQAIERERLKSRQSESRYRLLFNLSGEAVLIVDSRTRAVTEANPAAERLIGRTGLGGRPVASLVAPGDREGFVAFLGALAATDDVAPASVRFAETGRPALVSGVPFRQGGGSHLLLRLLDPSTRAPERYLSDLLERIPDPFVMTDEAFDILDANGAFLELVGHGRREDVVGLAIYRFLGRPGIDAGLFTAQLADHGHLHNLPTIVRTRFDEQLEVEVSAIAARDGETKVHGFTLRTVEAERPALTADMASPRSVEELTRLVGRMSLKDIVRESTDLIERLCIEAALKCADNNRASAAEILGLSRQGLYLKLHRHGLARDTGENRS